MDQALGIDGRGLNRGRRRGYRRGGRRRNIIIFLKSGHHGWRNVDEAVFGGVEAQNIFCLFMMIQVKAEPARKNSVLARKSGTYDEDRRQKFRDYFQTG